MMLGGAASSCPQYRYAPPFPCLFMLCRPKATPTLAPLSFKMLNQLLQPQPVLLSTLSSMPTHLWPVLPLIHHSASPCQVRGTLPLECQEPKSQRGRCSLVLEAATLRRSLTQAVARFPESLWHWRLAAAPTRYLCGRQTTCGCSGAATQL